MMKTIFMAIGLALGVALLPAGYVSANEPDAATFVKDSVITTKIKTQLAKENLASAKNIKVDTDNAGNVFLSGTAISEDEASRAVAIAESTKGVVAVSSKLVIKKESE